jgi:hypothetical protein
MKPLSIILLILFILYVIISPPIPIAWVPFLSSWPGKILLFSLVLLLFAFHHPVLSIVSVFVVMEILKKVNRMANPYPYELKYYSPFSPNHQFPYTLEQEMVKLRTPIQPKDMQPATFRPMLENTYDAAPIQ